MKTVLVGIFPFIYRNEDLEKKKFIYLESRLLNHLPLVLFR